MDAFIYVDENNDLKLGVPTAINTLGPKRYFNEVRKSDNYWHVKSKDELIEALKEAHKLGVSEESLKFIGGKDILSKIKPKPKKKPKSESLESS